MADETILITEKNIPVKLHDNGDGTWSVDVNATLDASAAVDIGDVSLLAGTALVGKVGIDQVTANANVVVAKGQGLNYKATLTVTNGAYTINDVVGGAISLTGLTIGKRYVFHTLVLAGVEALAYRLFFFETDIATPAADNAASTMVAADAAKWLGTIRIAASDYDKGVSAFNAATKTGLAFEFVPTATSVVAYMLADAVTSPGTDTLTLRLNGQQID